MFRNIPTITKNLLLINVIAFLANYVLSGQFSLNDFGRLHFFLAPDFHLYQLITYQFLHADITHIFFNMFALWMFGCVIERVWGAQKFLVYYLICGIGAGLCQEVVQYIEYSSGELSQLGMNALIPVRTDQGIVTMSVASYLNTWGTIGASGAVYGILLAFGMTFPNERIFIFPLPVPIKAKWFICIYAAIELFAAYSSSGDGVAHVAHLGGMLFGLLLILYWRRHPANFNMNSSRQYFDNMKRSFETRKQNRQQSTAQAQQTDTRQAGYGPTRQDDMEYNAEKQRRQAEVDAILDKIRKSGYDSLTKEEKQRLFEASRER